MGTIRRLLLALVLLGALIPARAEAAGGDYAFDGGTAAQQAQVTGALEASAFDWGIVPLRVAIHIAPGQFPHAAPGQIWLDGDELDAGRFAWATVQEEYGHQVDFFALSPDARLVLQQRLGTSDWCYGVPGLAHDDYGCERFAEMLAWAYWPSRHNSYAPTFAGDTTATMHAKQFRRLVDGLL